METEETGREGNRREGCRKSRSSAGCRAEAIPGGRRAARFVALVEFLSHGKGGRQLQEELHEQNKLNNPN
jgi:hypothetical protein